MTAVSRMYCLGIKPHLRPQTRFSLLSVASLLMWDPCCGERMICRLQFLLSLAKDFILGYDYCWIRGNVSLHHITISPNLQGQVPVFISNRNRVMAQLSSPPTTRRATVPVSTPELSRTQSQSQVKLRPTLSRPVCIGVRHPYDAHEQIFIAVMMWVTLSEENAKLQFTVAAGFRQRSLSRFWVPNDSRQYFNVSDLRHLQPGGPAPRICIPQAEGGPLGLWHLSKSKSKVPICGPWTNLYYYQTVAGLLMWGALSDESIGVYFTITAGPRQRCRSLVRVSNDSWPCFKYSHLRLPEPAGRSVLRKYIPREQCSPVSPFPTLGSPFDASYYQRCYGGGIRLGRQCNDSWSSLCNFDKDRIENTSSCSWLL
jgi:hypothetical protein